MDALHIGSHIVHRLETTVSKTVLFPKCSKIGLQILGSLPHFSSILLYNKIEKTYLLRSFSTSARAGKGPWHGSLDVQILSVDTVFLWA